MSQRRAANSKPPPVVAEATVVKAPLSLESPITTTTTKSSLAEEQVPLSTASDLSSNGNESPSIRVKKWKESPFAVGLTEPTWEAERMNMSASSRGGRKNDDLPIVDDEYLPKDTTGCLCCSAIVCSYLGAGRVGNMAVLSSSTEWVEFVEQDEETGEETVTRYTRPRLHWVVGPL